MDYGEMKRLFYDITSRKISSGTSICIKRYFDMYRKSA